MTTAVGRTWLLQLLRQREPIWSAGRVIQLPEEAAQADVCVSKQRPKVKRKATCRADGNTVASAPDGISIILMVAGSAATASAVVTSRLLKTMNGADNNATS